MGHIENLITNSINRVVSQVHDNQYHALIVSGKSQMLSIKWFHVSWRKQYGSQPIPTIHELGQEGNENLYAYDKLDRFSHPRISTRAQVDEYFKTNHPDFWVAKKEKLCYIDDVARNGTKHKSTVQTFSKMGFEQMDYAVICASSDYYLVPDIIIGSVSDTAAAEIFELAKGVGGTSTRVWETRSSNHIINESIKRVDKITECISAQ